MGEIPVKNEIKQFTLSCYKPSLWQRIKLLFSGNIWLQYEGESAIMTMDDTTQVEVETNNPLKWIEMAQQLNLQWMRDPNDLLR